MLAADTVLLAFNIFAANSTNETSVSYNDSVYIYHNNSGGLQNAENVYVSVDQNINNLNKNIILDGSNVSEEASLRVSKRDSENINGNEGLETGSTIPVTNILKAMETRDAFYEAREAAKNRVQVKLNMKQTLIMNQVIVVYALTASKNKLCRNHSKEFQDGLRAFEPWALKMFDSSAKLQSGILLGNLANFGSYKQCIEIYFKSQYGPITGKHCLLKIIPSEKVLKKILSYRNITEERFKHIKKSFNGASIAWAACVPDSCSSEDILNHFKKSITSIVEGLEVNITLSDMDCSTKAEDYKPFNKGEKIIMYSILGYFSVLLLCTFFDVWYRSKDVRRAKVIEIFSIYSNVAYLSKYQKEEAKLECLHGIRFISIVYVVFGHRYLMTLFFPSINALEILSWLLEYPSALIMGGTVSVDTFFLMSGSLVAYYFFEHMSKGGKFNYALFVIRRFIRLTPSYAFVVLFYGTFSEKLGSGPIWKRNTYGIQKPCQYFWWSSLLYITPYVNPEALCVLQTWSLACEMQFYFFSPIIMYPMWKWRRFGIFNFFLLYFISLIPGFYLAWTQNLEINMLMDSFLPISVYFAHFYTLPYVRAPTYILGLGFGYLLHKSKNAKIKMGKITLLFGWLCSSTIMIGTVLAHNYFELESYQYNRLKESLFIAMHRSIWTFGVIWIIWVCRSGYGGPVNSLLSAEIFQILGRLVYSIFLVHMPMQYLTWGALQSPMHFSNFECIQNAMGDFCLAMIFSFFLTILVEFPCNRILLHMFRVCSSSVKPVEEVKRNIE